MTTSQIAKLLHEHRFNFTKEAELQQAINRVFVLNRIVYSREVRLTDKDRIDFLVGNVGVEVKVDGSLSDVTRQLHRYVQSAEIESMLLVTTRLRHLDCPRFLNRKEIEVYYVSLRSAF